MKLLVHELKTELSQLVRTNHQVQQVRAIRPHLYRHGSPSGSLYIEIRDSNGGVVATSDSVAIADIGSNTYFHGYVRFYIKAHLLPETEYYVALESSGGYAFAENAYIGWCNDFDLRTMTADYEPNTGGAAALDMQIWTNQMVNRGMR